MTVPNFIRFENVEFHSEKKYRQNERGTKKRKKKQDSGRTILLKVDNFVPTTTMITDRTMNCMNK